MHKSRWLISTDVIWSGISNGNENFDLKIVNLCKTISLSNGEDEIVGKFNDWVTKIKVFFNGDKFTMIFLEWSKWKLSKN